MRILSRSAAVLLAPAVLLACQSTAVSPPPPAPPPQHREYTIEQFLGTTNVIGSSLSPDKSKVLVSHDGTGVYNAYAIPAAGGAPVALTDSTTDAIRVDSYFPRDERFLYHADRGGDELDHLYVRAPDGSFVDLTPGEKLKAFFIDWSSDLKSFFVATNERDARYFDIYEYRTTDYQRTPFYRDETGLQVAAISPDKRYLAFDKPITTSASDVLLWDRTSQTMRNLTGGPGDVANSAHAFSPDSAALYLTTDQDGEFSYLVKADLATGERVVVEQPQWDVMYATLSRRGKYLAVGINQDARTEIRLYDAASMARIAMPALADADIKSIGFSDDETTMTFYASTDRTPSDLYVWTVGTAAPVRLTHTLSQEIAERDLVAGQVVRFASYDGVQIPGILYRPAAAGGDAKVPALVWVHGGPGGQSRVGYRALVQYLVNHGYAVYAINNRGSSGYGKTFYRADDRKHGEADLDDCVASKAMLAATGWIDGDRIGIIGESYGGYMVLAALAFRPQEFRVGVDIFGVANWVRTLENIPAWWEANRKALYDELGDPARDRAYLERISPLFHAENIVRPLIVLQGANDPRVIQPESDDIVAAARANNVPVEYVIFPDEGHGFRKKENQQKAWEGILRFLDRHLKGAVQPAR